MATNERDHAIGQNLVRLRGDVSQEELADEMRGRGYKWSKATIWSIEQGTRPLRLSEAMDVLDVLGFTPSVDLPKLIAAPDLESVKFAASHIPTMREQLIIDFDTFTRYRQDLASDATTLTATGELPIALAEKVANVLSDSRLDDLVHAFMVTNAHYLTQTPEDNPYYEFLESGFDEDIELDTDEDDEDPVSDSDGKHADDEPPAISDTTKHGTVEASDAITKNVPDHR